MDYNLTTAGHTLTDGRDGKPLVARIAVGIVALQLGVYAYYVWFHPFSKFPGPPLSKIFNLPWLYTTLIKGNGPKSLLGLHQKYGKIVRLGPNHLAIDGSIGFPQVFGNRKVDHPKQANYFLDFPDSIIGSNTEVHRRQRRQLNPAFSESALKEQEPTIWRSVDLLLEKLGEKEASGEPVNIVEWVNFTIFDIIGDLMFAETFHSLERSGYHPWVQSIFTGVRMASIARFLRWYIPNWVLVMCMHLSGVMKLVHQNRAFAKQRSQARMDMGAVPEEGRRDFMTYMMRKDRNGEGLSETEIFANSPLIVGAGSETSATALAGLFFHLAQTPWAYKAVTDEIRTKFSSTDEINAQRVSSLEYLFVCIDETLRIYPPVCESPPRESTADTVVDGNFFPKGAIITVSHYATYHNPDNFSEADSFRPQRWFPPGHPLYEEKFKNDNKAAFKPFSFGNRECLGQKLAHAEMRILAARFLYRFDFELCRNQENWDDQLAWVIWNKGPLNLVLRRREG